MAGRHGQCGYAMFDQGFDLRPQRCKVIAVVDGQGRNTSFLDFLKQHLAADLKGQL